MGIKGKIKLAGETEEELAPQVYPLRVSQTRNSKLRGDLVNLGFCKEGWVPTPPSQS
jgi:hypothetical protein